MANPVRLQVNMVPLMLVGCMIVTAATFLSVNNLGSLPVLLPVLLLKTSKAVAVVPLVFFAYTFFVAGWKSSKVSNAAFLITAISVGLITMLSGLYYVASWKYRGVYQDSDTIDGFLAMNCFLGVCTIGLLVMTNRDRSPAWLVWTHISMFVWFFTFAFPYIGESL